MGAASYYTTRIARSEKTTAVVALKSKSKSKKFDNKKFRAQLLALLVSGCAAAGASTLRLGFFQRVFAPCGVLRVSARRETILTVFVRLSGAP